MGIFAIKVIMNKEFWRGLEYYLDKDKEKGVKVSPGGLIKDQYLDRKFFVREIDDNKIVEKLCRNNSKIAKSDGHSNDNIPDMYAYAVNLYDEVLSVYEIHNHSDFDKKEIRISDMREFYRNRGLSDEEIDEGERRLSIYGIRDGKKEVGDGLVNGVFGVITIVLTFISIGMAETKEALYGSYVMSAITILAMIGVIINLLRNIKKILYYRDKLLNGLEPDDEKRKVLSKSIFKYLKGEENKEETKRQ